MQRWLHRCLRALGWTCGVAVILLGVLMALTQLLLPLLARHPDWVAAQLSERVQRPIHFSSMKGYRTPSGPLFVMRNVSIGSAPGQTATPLQIPEADLKLDFGGWLVPSRHLVNLYVRGLQLDLAHDAEGCWHVNGIGVAGNATRQPISLGPLSMDVWLQNLRVVIADAAQGQTYTVIAQQLRLNRRSNEIHVGGLLQREGTTALLRAAGRFREDGRSGHLWIGVQNVDLKPLLQGVNMDGYTAERGHGHLSSWLEWHGGKLTDATLRYDLDQLSVSQASGAHAGVSALHGVARLSQVANGYDIRWASDDGSVMAISVHQPGTAQASVNVAARQVQLAPLLPWLALKPGLSLPLAQWLGGGHPRGTFDQLGLHWSQADGVQALSVEFSGLGIDAVGKSPGVADLHGELRGDSEAYALSLPTQAAMLQFPQRFRQPLALSEFGGTLALWPQDGDWHIGVDAIDFAGAGYSGQARGEVTLPSAGGAPLVDMYASLGHTDLVVAKQFLPLGVIPPGTIAWLDNALVAGSIDQAQVLVHGSLGDWPFRHNEGRFEARAQISDLTLDYGKDWPRAEGVSAIASFVDNGLSVETSAGHALGVNVDKAVALIPDFALPVLDLNVQGSGSGADVMDFVRKSPIGNRQVDLLNKLNLGGSATAGFHFVLPLTKPADAQLNGTAQLKDADFAAPDWNLKLDKINGPLRFDLRGLQGGPLDAGFRGQPSKLQLAIAGGNADPNTTFSAQLTGQYQFSDLLQDYPSLKWIGQLTNGRSDFSIGFTVAHAADQSALKQTVNIDSSLQGTALDLPVPLKKAADETVPLHVSVQLPIGGSDVQLALGQVMRGHLRLSNGPQKPLAATLALGGEMPTELPAQGLRIRGHADQMDVTGWVQRAVAGGSGDGPSLESVDISADHAALFGYPLGAMQIKATPQTDAISVDVEAATMSGNFSIPTKALDKRGITARLKRLYWPKDPIAAVKANAAPGAGSTASDTTALANASTAAASAPADTLPTDPANTGINPAGLPPFHLWLEDLRLGDAKLGEARLETWPTSVGLHIEQLRALSHSVQVNASGEWNGSATNSHTTMKIGFAADDLGAMLGAFGFEGLVNGGKTEDQLDASWPGAPSALTLATMEGTLSVHVSNGRIPEVSSPGAGRLLGLASLAELPRRFSLDFGDVFGKGLAFDSMVGDFHLANGVATTSSFKIHSPSGEVTITGRTDLRAKKFDQQVVVVPHVGNSLPLVGAVVGGPIGAAAGFAVQGLLGHGLNRAAGARYKITGRWDKPVMTLVEKRSTPETVAPAPLLAPIPANAVANPAPAASSGH